MHPLTEALAKYDVELTNIPDIAEHWAVDICVTLDLHRENETNSLGTAQL